MKTNEMAKNYAELKAKAERLSREAYEAGQAEKEARKDLESLIYNILRPETGFDFPHGPGVVLIGEQAVAYNIDEEGISDLRVMDEIPTLATSRKGSINLDAIRKS